MITLRKESLRRSRSRWEYNIKLLLEKLIVRNVN